MKTYRIMDEDGKWKNVQMGGTTKEVNTMIYQKCMVHPTRQFPSTPNNENKTKCICGNDKKKAPSEKTMEKWMSTGIAKATDGCKVEPDGHCPHGKPSWLIELGLI